MKECSKSIARRQSCPNFSLRYFRGQGLDIGGKPDPLALYTDLFPLMDEVRTWDWEDGDAQQLASVPDERYGFVHSSHCLEHLVDPTEGLKNWFRVLVPGGYLVITVPDEDLYEQGEFPSSFNADHKWTFSIWKVGSWSQLSVNVLDLIKILGEQAAVEKIELLSASFREGLPRYDQTLTPVGECGIEIVIRKRTREEIALKGRPVPDEQPNKEARIHLNQYRDDLASLKRGNSARPPFDNDEAL